MEEEKEERLRRALKSDRVRAITGCRSRESAIAVKLFKIKQDLDSFTSRITLHQRLFFFFFENIKDFYLFTALTDFFNTLIYLFISF